MFFKINVSIPKADGR